MDKSKQKEIDKIIKDESYNMARLILLTARNIQRKTRKGYFSLDTLERAQRECERYAEDKIRKLSLTYSEQCNAIMEADIAIENELDKYFKLAPNAYDWINGNNNWKKLLANKIRIPRRK